MFVASAANAQPAPPPDVTLRVNQPNVRAIDGIVVDLDTSGLRASSNLRLAVVPVATPDAIADANAFAGDSLPVSAGRLHLTIAAGAPGQDEVRLYHIPQFASTFAVAARTKVTVAPGVAGAVLLRDVVREAVRLGPVRFEAKYRNTSALIQAQFLRVRPQTDWNINWVNGLPVGVVAQHAAILSLGTRGVPLDTSGAANEAICLVGTDSGPALDQIAALNPGDAIVVQAKPSTWSSATSADPLLLVDCRLGK